MILVTGASGNIGHSITTALVQNGVAVRALVRDARKATALPHEVEVTVGDFADPVSLARAVRGVKRVFMVCLPDAAPARLVKHSNLIQAAQQADVEHVVYLSFLNPAADAGFPQARWHFATESQLRVSGMAWTFLRASLYAQSVLSSAGMFHEIVWAAPAGDGRVAFVDRDDIAAVATQCLVDAGHTQQAYDVTGPRLLSWQDVATLLAELRGHPIVYHNVAPQVFGDYLRAQGRPPAFIEGMLGLFADIRAHRMEQCTDTVRTIGKREPRHLRNILAAQLERT